MKLLHERHTQKNDGNGIHGCEDFRITGESPGCCSWDGLRSGQGREMQKMIQGSGRMGWNRKFYARTLGVACLSAARGAY